MSLPRGALDTRLGPFQRAGLWEESVEGMRVGGQRRVLVPPTSSVTAVRDGAIPEGETAVFEITLVGVESGSPQELGVPAPPGVQDGHMASRWLKEAQGRLQQAQK